MNRVFCQDIPAPGETVALESDESRHLVRVRRANVGDEVGLFDGRGKTATGRVASISKRDTDVEVLTVSDAPPDTKIRVTVASAIPKGQRMADLLRACTEIGAREIRPVVTERSSVRPEPGSTSDRWSRIVREASKQSGRNHFPSVATVADFDEVLVSAPEYDLSLIADTAETADTLRDVLDGRQDAESFLLLIGPEGGFSDDERNRARDAGFSMARLDTPIMRVETAAPAILAALIAMHQ